MPTRAVRSASAPAIAWIFLASPSPRMRIFSASAVASVWMRAASWRERSVLGLPLVRLDVDRELRFGDERLLLGARLRLAQLLLLHRRTFLPGVGLDLLLGDLAGAELRQDGLDLAAGHTRRRRADQHFLQFQVVLRELLLHLLARHLLDGAAVLDQLNQRAGLADVLEVRRHHRIERLLDQALDVAEPLDHQRRLAVVDVDDDR